MLRAWWSTLHYRIVRYDPTADPADPGFVGPNIYIFWHEYIPMPVYVRPNCRLSMLLSQHQDAEIMSHMAELAGMGTVRGSSRRGATGALRELMHVGKGLNLAITPDGPRGPRRQLAIGCIYLSMRLQVPIVGVGVGYDRPWRLTGTWDQFAVPRPFSRCRAVLGPRLQVPPELGREDLQTYRQHVETMLNTLTETAERWAAGEIELPGAANLYPLAPRGGRLRSSTRVAEQRSDALPLRLRRAS